MRFGCFLYLNYKCKFTFFQTIDLILLFCYILSLEPFQFLLKKLQHIVYEIESPLNPLFYILIYFICFISRAIRVKWYPCEFLPESAAHVVMIGKFFFFTLFLRIYNFFFGEFLFSIIIFTFSRNKRFRSLKSF